MTMPKNLLMTVVLSMSCLVLMGAMPAAASPDDGGAQSSPPPEARAYAEEVLPAQIQSGWGEGVTMEGWSAAEEADAYHFDLDAGPIRTGPLHATYRPSEGLLAGELGESLSDRLVPREEWITALSQGDAPRNVAGVWQPADGDGAWHMSTLGYGQRLALQVDGLDSDERLLFEAPLDAWYAVDAKTVRPLSGDLRDFTPMTWEEYAQRLAADVETASNVGGDDAVTGGYAAAERSGGVPPEGLLAALAIVALAGVGVLVRRRVLRPEGAP